MSFAKFAAEALVTPEEIDDQAKRDRWKKWLLTVGGLGAMGAAGAGIYSNWDSIAKATDKLVPHIGPKPGVVSGPLGEMGTNLPVAGGLTAAIAGEPRFRLGQNSLRGLVEKAQAGGDQVAAPLKRLNSLFGGQDDSFVHAVEQAKLNPQHPFNKAFQEAGAGKIGPSLIEKMQGVFSKKAPPAAVDTAAVPKIDPKVLGERLQSLRAVKPKIDIGRMAARGVGGAVAGAIGQQLGL